ncbi:lactonase family protein [Nonomuraea rhizosphaerae]|uniref:lactonase family protein n=1 Tax=Nonomuraea rhizosphaerae TaxID=2665663 RepID=UPI001C5F99A0|nr:beta-propeller fold lactonase family protein [Nonomuraea rhizosphaerae]
MFARLNLRSLTPYRLLVAVLAGAVLLTAGAPAASGTPPGRKLYVTNGDTNDISIFDLDADGRPVPGPALFATGRQARGIVFTPDGRTAYVVAGAENKVYQYRVRPDGTLTSLAPPVPTGAGAFGIAVAPSGRTVYVTAVEAGTVTSFSVGDDGKLGVGKDVPTGKDSPRGVTLTPDGRFLYVSHGRPAVTPDTGPPGFVVVFAVDAKGEPVGPGRPFPVERGGLGLSVTPDGRFLYVACEVLTSVSPRQLFGFRIDADGGLTTQVPGSPFRAPDVPVGTAVTRDGQRLYVTSGGLNNTPELATKVWGFSIDRYGSLAPLPGSPYTAGPGPTGIALSPDGRRAYVSTLGRIDRPGSELVPFAIGGDGRLIPLGGPVLTGGVRSLFQSVALPPR